MRYTLPNNKTITIDDKIIEKSMSALELTKDEAIQMYLEDEGYLDNAEQVALDNSARKVKIQHEAYEPKERKKSKPRTSSVSDEKKALFNCILANLDRCVGENFEVSKENITVVKENKLIEVKIGGKTFKIDVIEKRPPKKN